MSDSKLSAPKRADPLISTPCDHQCRNCGTPYFWQRSTSWLKMTYCGSMCEQADLGYTLEAFAKMRRVAVPV